MKKILVFFLLIATLGSCISCASPFNKKLNTPETNKQNQTIEHVLKSTVTLISPEQGPYCSGFFISPTRIVTARHCIDQNNLLSISNLEEIDKIIIETTYKSEDIFLLKYSKKNSQLTNIQKSDILVARVVYISKTNSPENNFDVQDIAILEINKQNKSKHWLVFDNKEPYPGEKIMVIGAPFAIPWTITLGNVAHLEYDLENNYLGFLASSVIMSGSSGSPVVNEKGECLGLLSSVLDVNAQFASPGKHIPEGNIGLVIGIASIQKHLKYLKQ